MSSAESLLIFDRAVEFIHGRLGRGADVDKVLTAFRARIDTDSLNPLDNRELFVEPGLDAQLIDVPRETLELVAGELRKFNLLSVWVRAECPLADDDDNTIVETQNAKVFLRSLHEPCPHCGNLHESLGWESLTTLYAFNFTGKPDRFRLSKFIGSDPQLPNETATLQGSTFGSRVRTAIRRLSGFFKPRERPPDKVIAGALEQNGPPVTPPSQRDIGNSFVWFAGIVLSALLLIAAIAWHYSQPAAMLIWTGGIAIAFAAAWLAWRIFWASRTIEARILGVGGAAATTLFLMSAGVTIDTDGKLDPDRSGQLEKFLNSLVPFATWSVRVGECDHHCMWAGSAVVALTLLSVTVLAGLRIVYGK